MPSGKGRIFVVRVSAWLYFKSSTSQQYRKHVVVTFSMFKKKKKSSGQEPERKMNSSLLGDVRAVQPSTSSPLYCQAGVATATLTLCKPHRKQDESGENHCVLLHYFSLAVCLCVCACVCVCLYVHAAHKLSIRIFWFCGLCMCALVFVLHKQGCCIIASYLHSIVTWQGLTLYAKALTWLLLQKLLPLSVSRWIIHRAPVLLTDSYLGHVLLLLRGQWKVWSLKALKESR